ncbi:unnamed protein product, partial [Rotaria sp. Silwood2]
LARLDMTLARSPTHFGDLISESAGTDSGVPGQSTSVEVESEQFNELAVFIINIDNITSSFAFEQI